MTALGAISRLVPDRVIARLLPPGRSFDPRSPAPALEFPQAASSRVLIGPVNAAGQGERWARALERSLPSSSAVSLEVVRVGGFAHEAGMTVPAAAFTWSRDWQRALRRAVADRVTHVLLESGRPLLAGGVRGDVDDDLRWLERQGIPTVLVWHGSDVRDGARHAREHPHSPYRLGAWEHTELDAIASRNRDLAARSGLRSLVSTPDLLDDVPGARWLPVVIDPHAWSADAAPLAHGGPLRVVHAPSSGVIKGSELVEPIVRALADQGVIEYRRIDGVPHAEMPDALRWSDVVLEQFRLGSYGVTAVEAMAAGRIVISDVSSRVADRARSACGLRLPILSAAPESLERTLRSIAAEPSAARAHAADGPAFVARLHDGSLAASVIAEALDLPEAGVVGR